MPKIVDSEQKRRDILDAALRVFTEQGYKTANLQRVARAAGMGKSTLYHYFDTKEELFSALADDLIRREASVLEVLATSDAEPRARFDQLLDSTLGLCQQWVSLGPFLFDMLAEPAGRRSLSEVMDHLRDLAEKLIAEGQRAEVFRPGDPRAMAIVLIACVDGLILQDALSPGTATNPTVVATVKQLVCRAICL
jgi:AcrR family transcriptional regulator